MQNISVRCLCFAIFRVTCKMLLPSHGIFLEDSRSGVAAVVVSFTPAFSNLREYFKLTIAASPAWPSLLVICNGQKVSTSILHIF
jgi:hypothetical protein